MITRTLLGVAAAATTLALTACGSSDSGSDTGKDSSASSGLHLVDAGTLTVCSDVPYAPFEDFDKTTATGFKGFDVDIVSYVAKDLGVKLKIVDSDFDGLQSGLSLNSGSCDLAASAMTITDDRKKHLSFADGYYDSMQSLLVPEGSAIASIDDLDGKKVGVQKGTTGKQYATDNAKGATIVDFPSDAELFPALKAGQIDAILQDLPVNLEHQKAGGFKVAETYKTDEQYGLAAKVGNTALVDAVNKSLAKMKSDGTYKTVYDNYFATN
jgi:polar amino acid transport system substrate-binding protein